MKDKLLTILTVILIGALLVMLQGCKDDPTPEPGEDEIFKNRISQTWKANRVVVDNVDVTSSFKNMTITFRADQTYSVANAVSPIWSASGSYELIPRNDGAYDLKRNDGTSIEIESLTDSNVILELFYTSTAGRVAGVSGEYRFEMTR